MIRSPSTTKPAPTPRAIIPAFHGALSSGDTSVAVIRTRLFWIGPFGRGGTIGTGTATTDCVVALGCATAPGKLGLACGGEGAGAVCCASDVDAINKLRQSKMRARFMAGKSEKMKRSRKKSNRDVRAR